MLKQVKNENILFLDVETVPQYASHNDAPETYKELWEHKSAHFRKENESSSDVFQRAGIYAEFGKIICISVGLIFNKSGKKAFRIKSFFGNEEKTLLTEFKNLLDNISKNTPALLCGHNGKEFDFPYIARRMLVNGIQLPAALDVAGKKPWEVPFLDTMELWKFGDYKNYTSLKVLCYIFNIPSPKDDIDGSQVAEVYYNEKNLERIVNYCEKDVLSVAQILLRYKGEELISEENIEKV
jgi:3'-5' exonuclease